jgi:pyridoxamine 5'-phosphate oxidase
MVSLKRGIFLRGHASLLSAASQTLLHKPRTRFANLHAANRRPIGHNHGMAETDPVARFQEWFAAAQIAEASDATAMALATADAAGRPSVRMVLLKHVDVRGFVFYTNLESPKSADLHANPRAALCIHWPKLERQVCIHGQVEPVSDTEADAYFASRPRLSQLGAWASRQSQPIAGRFVLEQAVAAAALRFPLGAVPRPPYWSGWRVVPERLEFWQQRPFRHHDRQRFIREGESWRSEWLFP